MIGPLTFHEAIRQFDPDVFMAWDHLRPEFARIIPTQLPVLTWDQDQLPHVFTKANLDRVAAHDFLAGYSKPAHLRAGRPAAQYLNARVPACPEQFSGPPLTAGGGGALYVRRLVRQPRLADAGLPSTRRNATATATPTCFACWTPCTNACPPRWSVMA